MVLKLLTLPQAAGHRFNTHAASREAGRTLRVLLALAAWVLNLFTPRLMSFTSWNRHSVPPVSSGLCSPNAKAETGRYRRPGRGVPAKRESWKLLRLAHCFARI